MKPLAVFFASALCLSFASSCGAAPLVLETEEAKIFVVRPLDLWSGDKAMLESSLSDHAKKTANYVVRLNNDKYLFSNMPGQPTTGHPITKAVAGIAEQASFSLPRSSLNYFEIHTAVAVPPQNMPAIQEFQAAAFRRAVIQQGDPEALQSKTSRGKVIGGILSLGLAVVSADKFGLSAGAHATLGSGISEGVYNLASQYSGGLAPVVIGSENLSEFKQIDIRRVVTARPDRTGQVVIAYKNEKTPEAENAALVKAVVALIGTSSSTADIEKARAEDFAARKAIWSQCVAEGNPSCKQ